MTGVQTCALPIYTLSLYDALPIWVFEVTLIREIRNALDFQQLINAFMTQRLESCDMIYSFKTNNITFESPDNIKWTLDGEFGGEHNKVNLKVCPKAVDFIINKEKPKAKMD